MPEGTLPIAPRVVRDRCRHAPLLYKLLAGRMTVPIHIVFGQRADGGMRGQVVCEFSDRCKHCSKQARYNDDVRRAV